MRPQVQVVHEKFRLDVALEVCRRESAVAHDVVVQRGVELVSVGQRRASVVASDGIGEELRHDGEGGVGGREQEQRARGQGDQGRDRQARSG